jgi:hypothetical protein
MHAKGGIVPCRCIRSAQINHTNAELRSPGRGADAVMGYNASRFVCGG